MCHIHIWCTGRHCLQDSELLLAKHRRPRVSGCDFDLFGFAIGELASASHWPVNTNHSDPSLRRSHSVNAGRVRCPVSIITCDFIRWTTAVSVHKLFRCRHDICRHVCSGYSILMGLVRVRRGHQAVAQASKYCYQAIIHTFALRRNVPRFFAS